MSSFGGVVRRLMREIYMERQRREERQGIKTRRRETMMQAPGKTANTPC